MTREAFLEAVLEGLQVRLRGLGGTWERLGNELRGPSGLAVRLAERHPGGPHHVDIALVLDRDRDAPVLWDCIAFEDPAGLAHVWTSTVAPIGLELLRRDGTFADHDGGMDGYGMPGWHTIVGPVLAYGSEPAEPLRDWVVSARPLGALAATLGPALSADRLHGVKLLVLGGPRPTAEVRVDGEVHEEASAALFAMPWPQAITAVARQHFALLHRA